MQLGLSLIKICLNFIDLTIKFRVKTTWTLAARRAGLRRTSLSVFLFVEHLEICGKLLQMMIQLGKDNKIEACIINQIHEKITSLAELKLQPAP